MLAGIYKFIHPFSMIAQELHILRELYELELRERDPPIIRITEKPSKSDTEITYTGVEEPRKRSALERAKELLAPEEDGEEIEDE